MTRATEVERVEGSEGATGALGYPVGALRTGGAWDPGHRGATDQDQHWTSR
jgi:hypothetical protein